MRLLPLLLLGWTGLGAQDWPQILGPTRDGVYTGAFSAGGDFGKVWARPVGEGFSAPAVSSGRVLLFHRQDGKEILESLDPATGKTQWKFAYPTAYRDDFGFSEGPRATPTVDGDRVFIYGAEGMLHAVNLQSGAKLWSLDGRKEFGVRKEFFGTACSPLVTGGRLLMNIGGANGAGIVALDVQTGKTLWKALNDEAGYSSPTLATIGGQAHALFFTRQGLVDADPASGRIRFQFPWRARQAASVNAAIPLVVGNQVFLSASYNTGAVLLNIQSDSAKPVWSGDESLSNHYATSVYKDGYLYGFHGRQEYGQELRCVEWKSGNEMWSVSGLGAGSVTLARDHLLVIRENGEMLIAPATPKQFRPSKKVKLASSTVRAYPALSGGRLYFRSNDTLTAIRID